MSRCRRCSLMISHSSGRSIAQLALKSVVGPRLAFAGLKFTASLTGWLTLSGEASRARGSGLIATGPINSLT
jgi:hypothetical protein